jgi:hypothetical protein
LSLSRPDRAYRSRGRCLFTAVQEVRKLVLDFLLLLQSPHAAGERDMTDKRAEPTPLRELIRLEWAARREVVSLDDISSSGACLLAAQR